jgi:hypothetical protein
MKNFEDFKMNEEWSQQDAENLLAIVGIIQQKVPSFAININGLNGRVTVNGNIIFSTHGGETPTIIYAFVNGYYFGLTKGD